MKGLYNMKLATKEDHFAIFDCMKKSIIKGIVNSIDYCFEHGINPKELIACIVIFLTDFDSDRIKSMVCEAIELVGRESDLDIDFPNSIKNSEDNT